MMIPKTSLNNLKILFLCAFVFPALCCAQNKNTDSENNLTWTYTYIKSKNEERKHELKQIILKNWFAMDSIAKEKGLINDYQLIENISTKDDLEWDFIVAVEYYTEDNYSDIAQEFEKIRESHQTVKVNGFIFPQVGLVVKSELVRRTH